MVAIKSWVPRCHPQFAFPTFSPHGFYSPGVHPSTKLFLKKNKSNAIWAQKELNRNLFSFLQDIVSRQIGSSGSNKVEGPQVSPHILPFQPSAPMAFILLGLTFPPFLKKSEPNADSQTKLNRKLFSFKY